MSTRESVQLRVGLFIFAGVFLAMVVIFFLGGQKQLFKRPYVLVSYFDDISGLRVGDPVFLAGVRVGVVDRILFSGEPKDKRVEAKLSIDHDYQERIRNDSVASIVTQGLLGDKAVSISVGGVDQKILQDQEILSSEERPSLFSIAEKGGAIMQNVNQAAKVMDRLLTEVEKGDGLLHRLVYESREKPVGEDFSQMAKELRDASKELHEILARVNHGEGTIGALLTDRSVYDDIRKLFGKLERNRLLRHVIRSRLRDLELEEEKGQKSKH